MTATIEPCTLPETGTPVDQPILARCGMCDELVVYGVTPSAAFSADDGGLILEPWSSIGGTWSLFPDGRYGRRNNASRVKMWGQDGHRCPRALLMRIRSEERKRTRAVERTMP